MSENDSRQNKNVVFEWHTRDHFSFGEADTFFLSHLQPTYIWTHSNSLDLDTDGNILMSTRNFNEITKINRADSSIMWRFGGSQNEFTFVNSPYPFYGEHAARRLPNGHIILYDNGNDYVSHGARAVEYELDEVNKIATQVWSYTLDSTAFSRSLGNAQRLDNGNTLIDYGTIINNNVCFNVVDPNGTKIFELISSSSYRAFNYPSLPWQLHRPQISCFDSLGVSWLDAGAGNASYAWNNGDTTRIVQATEDTFYVFVPYGQGGFISSERVIITDSTNACGFLSVAEPPRMEELSVFPNPAENHLTYSYYLLKPCDVEVSLYDFSGRKIMEFENKDVYSGKHDSSLDLSNLSAGFYFLRMNGAVKKFVKD